MAKSTLPIVYSCSGCSNLAQLSNSVALHLDETGHAQMSCIAGVGGKVKGLVKLAKSGRKIIALDGCKLHCVAQCLQGVDVAPDIHLTFTDEGLKKGKFEAPNLDDVSGWADNIIARLAQA